MIEIKKVNSDYPTVTLEFPQIVFRDATQKEKTAIDKSRAKLRQQLFYLDASETLNILESYLKDYPNATFELSVESEYDDEGYSDQIHVNASSTNANEQSEIEDNDIGDNLSYELDMEVVNSISQPVNRESFDSIGEELLGKKLYKQWKLGKIGLEKKHLEDIVNDPKTQEKSKKI
jgi:hypothetical protein